MKIRYLAVFLMLLFLGECTRPGKQAKTASPVVRQPAVAGAFYPSKPEDLRAMVRGFLDRAKKTSVEGDIIGLLVPHAGYIYSGLTAAHSYKVIGQTHWDTVIIIGTSHRPGPGVLRGGFGLIPSGSFVTPLGSVPIDADTAGAILAGGGGFTEDAESHLTEHSIETQLPFLQVVLGDFTFVPIVVGMADYASLEKGVQVLSRVLAGKKALLIASSDLSHYPADKDARRVDAEDLSALTSMDPVRFKDTCAHSLHEGVAGLEVAACGEDAVLLTLMTAIKLGATRAALLSYADSHDSGGEAQRVVGYGAVAFYRTRSGAADLISPGGRKALLTLSRRTLVSLLTQRRAAAGEEPGPGSDEELARPLGAFVTLKKRGDLRGCIGNIVGGKPLYESVRDMTAAAATQDPRFPPVAAGEIKDITIEISVLSPLRKIGNAGEITMGTHGVVIQNGLRTGVFLPQVATETGWNREEFLNELCTQKAGLPSGCWKDKSTEVYVFTAQVFSE